MWLCSHGPWECARIADLFYRAGPAFHWSFSESFVRWLVHRYVCTFRVSTKIWHEISALAIQPTNQPRNIFPPDPAYSPGAPAGRAMLSLIECTVHCEPPTPLVRPPPGIYLNTSCTFTMQHVLLFIIVIVICWCTRSGRIY